MNKQYIGERRSYTFAGLERDQLSDDPFEQAQRWLAEAEEAGIVEPSAMALATVSSEGLPSNRMVLLRKVDTGFVFFTNYRSRKGQDLDHTHVASAVFWWAQLERQLRIDGTVHRISDAESDDYFRSRPEESQLASLASPQSERIDSREQLEGALEFLRAHSNLERPAHWGGYRILPTRFEFWQGRPARLHDRFEYVPEGDGWSIYRLAP